jgi:hypothetical protein
VEPIVQIIDLARNSAAIVLPGGREDEPEPDFIFGTINPALMLHGGRNVAFLGEIRAEGQIS